ncbi:MAG: hypothetical protein ACYTGN_05040 [Planctomycetota bacterium]|jgi:hypothetical protein
MNALLTHWKLFAAFLLIGLFASFGLRAAASGGTGATAPSEPERAPAPPPGTKPKEAAKGLLIDVGNTTCPIMEGPVDGKTFGEWKHLRVGYCCAGCDEQFQEDPEALLDKTGAEWREAARAVDAYLAATGEHKQHLLAGIRKRWTVVREPNGG